MGKIIEAIRGKWAERDRITQLREEAAQKFADSWIGDILVPHKSYRVQNVSRREFTPARLRPEEELEVIWSIALPGSHSEDTFG